MHRTVLLLVVVALIPRAAAAQGDPVGPEFRVNTYTPGDQGGSSGYVCGYSVCQNGPAAAADSAGNFVVVWTSEDQDGSGFGIFGQRYSASGDPIASEFRVNTYTTGRQGYEASAAVASDSAGNFVVAWQSDAQDGSDTGIFGQRYAASGLPAGPEFRVNTYTTGFQMYASVAADSDGNFVVVWSVYAPGILRCLRPALQ